MKRNGVVGIVFWSINAAWLLILFTQAAYAQADPQSSIQRYALLIGINEYQSKSLNDLRGAVNDTMLIRRILTTKYGFNDKNIQLITDTDATRDKILESMENLVKIADSNDVVYIHFSGHGSRIEDYDGDEKEDNMDETLVPHDGRMGKIPDITDDELKQMLAKLSTDAAVIVLDTCHSGTATRATRQVTTRYVFPDERKELYKASSVTTRKVVPLIGERHVLFAAAAADQEALDAPIDGTNYGLFSYAFARSLEMDDSTATIVSVIGSVEREMEKIKPQLAIHDLPEPQLEGPSARLAKNIFPPLSTLSSDDKNNDESSRLSWVSVQPTENTKLVVLRDSVPLGAVQGSLWAIYKPGEQEFRSGGALAEVLVTERRGDDAYAKVENSIANIEPDSRAVLLMGPVPTASIPVRWLAVKESDRKKLQQNILSRTKEVRFVAEHEFARFMLELEGKICKVYGADGVTLLAEIEAKSNKHLATKLVSIFTRSLTMTELTGLNNPLSNIKLNIKLASQPQRSAKKISLRGVRIVSEGTSTPRLSIRRDGQKRNSHNSLQLQVESSVDCYLTLVDVDSQGKVTVLFPNAFTEQAYFYKGGYITRGEVVLIPDSLAPKNRANFYIDMVPPSGLDNVYGFCSTEKGTAELIRKAISDIADQSTSSDTAVNRSVRTGLRRFLTGDLRLGLTQAATRGRGVVLIGVDEEQTPTDIHKPSLNQQVDWAATSMSIYVEE